MRVEGNVTVRSMQNKHNLNSNNNLMGFDTIEINLVQNFCGSTALPELSIGNVELRSTPTRTRRNWKIDSILVTSLRFLDQ